MFFSKSVKSVYLLKQREKETADSETTKKDGTDWYTNVNEEYVALNVLLRHHMCNFLWNIVTV